MIIRNFNINLNYISNNGETRQFVVDGNKSSIFSLVIEKLTGTTVTYYNFSTQTFTSTFKRLKNRKITSNSYTESIVFPAGGLSSGNNPNTYTIKLYAESAWGTKHVRNIEKRFPDNTLDLNSSTGSNSDLLQKVLYQFPETAVTLAAISPNSLSAFSGIGIAIQTINVQRGNNTGKIPFTITCTLGSSKVGKLKRQPQTADITSFSTRTLGEPLPIPGVTANQGGESGISLTITDLPRSNSNTFTVNEIAATAVGMTIKGVAFDGVHDKDHPVIVTAINSNTVTINKNVSIANVSAHASVTANDIRYRRWKCNEIQRLSTGMLAFSGGVSAGTRILGYKDVSSYDLETQNADGSVQDSTFDVVNFDIPALDVLGYQPVYSHGVLDRQQGIITFDTPQVVSSNRNVGTKLYGYGPSNILTINNSSIKITNLKAEITEVSTTINDTSADGVTSLNDFDVASISGIMDDVSTVHGVNLNATGVTPTVTTISSSNLTLTPGGHFVQNGQTLTFKGAGRVFTITGEIEFENVDTRDFSLRFDLEKFITAS
tara:strand:+ start:623 stop:2260 length:1638 start_codon:yes stop_codon:yes gene_type:complete